MIEMDEEGEAISEKIGIGKQKIKLELESWLKLLLRE